MIRAAVAAGWIMAAGAAFSQELPALHDVAGIAAGDVLNLRTGPGTSHEIIGSLSPDARGVEVTALSPDGRWGRVNLNEGTAWASMRFLAAVAGREGTALPLRCFGTEPFWSLDMTEVGATLITPDDPGEPLPALSDAQTFASAAYVFGDTDSRLTAVVGRRECSDGMSDRLYGLGVDVLTEADGASELLSGCCSLVSR